MRLGTAIERLVNNYRYASDKEWINDKVAWALYHTWKEADRKTENSSEKPNNSTISKMEQVEYEPQTEELPPYLIRDWEGYLDDFEVEDEPQTDCAWK